MDPSKVKESDAIDVTVVTPEGTLYHGKVGAITLNNERGVFDVIPYHETFISLINQQLIIYPLEGEKKEMAVDKGVIRVHKNMVDIFLGLDTQGIEPQAVEKASK